MHFRFGELFCGPGGIALGAKHADIGDPSWAINHAWATDYDADACDTYRLNICPDSPNSVRHADIRNFDFTTLSSIDALAFGFPCNDFSQMGEKKGINGNFGPLYTHGIKALKHFKPAFFLAENVGGLRSANDGEVWKTILTELHDAGYTITPHLYKFEEYGIPQRRHRIIIIGIRDDLNLEFKVPCPTPHASDNNSCREAIECPPIPEGTLNNEPTIQSPTVIKRLEHTKPGENAFTADLPEDVRLNIKGAHFSQIYKRLEPDKPAYTITGSGGGGTYVYHWSEPRALTNRERARLQTFPDDFVFMGSRDSVRKQIGMAVPYVAAKIIFEAVLKTFAQVDYPSVDANVDISFLESKE